MPTTSNFGWTTPADTDLVKDGALAIRTLGNGIDTSLVDLKGGTTDQVLAKNSNTDMDFKWVTSDDANAIQNAIVDAKGDLIAASANDTPARLAVGANDTILIAASGETTGLKWGGAWTTWSPTTSGFTKGNGTEVARYVKIGKTVFYIYKFTLGSTSSISGAIQVSLPSTANSDSQLAYAYFDDFGTGAFLATVIPTTTNVLVYASNASTTYLSVTSPSATIPMTWATNDVIRISGQYEEA